MYKYIYIYIYMCVQALKFKNKCNSPNCKRQIALNYSTLYNLQFINYKFLSIIFFHFPQKYFSRYWNICFVPGELITDVRSEIIFNSKSTRMDFSRPNNDRVGEYSSSRRSSKKDQPGEEGSGGAAWSRIDREKTKKMRNGVMKLSSRRKRKNAGPRRRRGMVFCKTDGVRRQLSALFQFLCL